MGNDALIGLVAITAILLSGIFVRGLLERMVFSQRIKLFERGKALLDRSDLTKTERMFVNFTLDEYDSFRAGWIVPKAMIRALMKKVRNEEARQPAFERTTCLVVPFSLSALVANPFALVATVLLTPILLVAAAVRQHEGPKDAIRDAAREVTPKGWAGRFAH